MDKELQEIIDEMEFDADEDKTAFEKLMAGKVGKKIQAGYMKAKDYTTKTQALSQAKKELETKAAEFNEGQEYQAKLMGTYKTDMEKRLQDALNQVSKTSLRGAALETKIRKMAAEFGEDPEALLADVQEQRIEAKKPDAAFDWDSDDVKKRIISRDEFTNAANGMYAFAPMIRDFERDYAKTFGKEYDGSITELLTTASQEVKKLQERGQNVNMFDHLRTKLDFAGQKQRNDEAAKVAANEERTKWETQTREEIERDVRSKVLAENPNALRGNVQWEREQWRDNLGAKARQNQIPQQTPQEEFSRRQSLHQKFEENAAKAGAAT